MIRAVIMPSTVQFVNKLREMEERKVPFDIGKFDEQLKRAGYSHPSDEINKNEDEEWNRNAIRPVRRGPGGNIQVYGCRNLWLKTGFLAPKKPQNSS